MNNLACVILAAGEGTRMKSDFPKVLHKVAGKPMLGHVLDTAESLGIKRIVVIAGSGIREVRRFVGPRASVVEQKKRLGSGHAVMQAQSSLKGYSGDVLVLYGDAPLVQKATLAGLVHLYRGSRADGVVLSAVVDDPAGYGRILKNGGGIERIVEDRDASSAEKAVSEINVGPCCFKREDLFKALGEIRPNGPKNEYYLTDVVEKISRRGRVLAHVAPDARETAGINSRKELALAENLMNERTLERLMAQGVTIKDLRTVFIGPDVKIGQDTIINPHTVIEGPATIGRRCEIGPFARIRQNVILGDEVGIGNYVEIVRSKIGDRTLVKHLSYLGDAEVGPDANIGAGTITANFDGKRKQKTVIGAKAQIGSGTVFVAPIRIGRGAKTGAGAVVTRGHDVKAGEVVVGVPARTLTRRHSRGRGNRGGSSPSRG